MLISPDTRYGYIDQTGKIVIPVQVELAAPFVDGIARVVAEGKTGYINQRGEYVWKPSS